VEVFEESKKRSVATSGAASAKAPGKEIVSSRCNNNSSNSGSGSGSGTKSKGTKAGLITHTWQCACCKHNVRVTFVCVVSIAQLIFFLKKQTTCCIWQFEVHNWPRDFDVTVPAAVLGKDGEDKKEEEKVGAEGAEEEEEDEKEEEIDLDLLKDMEPAAFAWAVKQIKATKDKDKNTAFQMPANYQVNRKEAKVRRARRVVEFKQQWAKALDSLNMTHSAARGASKTVVPSAQQSGGSDANSGDKQSWLCGACVVLLGKVLVGALVVVWWHDDAQPYRGRIDAYDDTSRCHRVFYEDEEWEFVNLALEPVVFAFPDGAQETPEWAAAAAAAAAADAVRQTGAGKSKSKGK
jgi:hypothetical protein